MDRDRKVENQDKVKTGPKEEPSVGKPGWANGLRQLYDSVVDEPLPDSFKDLLSKLDDEG